MAVALAGALLLSCAPEVERRVRLPLPLLRNPPARPGRRPPRATKQLREQASELLEPLRDAGVTRAIARRLEDILIRMPDSGLGAIWHYLLDGNERLALFAAEYFDRRGRLRDVPRGARSRYLILRMENLAIFFEGPPVRGLPHVREMKILSRFDASVIRDILGACARAPDEDLRNEFLALVASLTGESRPTVKAWREWTLEHSFELTEAEAELSEIDGREVVRRLKARMSRHPDDLAAMVGYALAAPVEAGRFLLRMDAWRARKERARALAFVSRQFALPVLCQMVLADEDEVRRNAATSLSWHRSPAATPYLVKALARADRRTRYLAALGLARTADRRAALALAQAWKYNAGEVADEAREGLRRITGREFVELSAFEEWFSAHGAELGEQIELVLPTEEKSRKDRAILAQNSRMFETLPIEDRARFWLWRCDVYDLPFSQGLAISDPFRKLVSLGDEAVRALAGRLNYGTESERAVAASALGEIGGEAAKAALRAASEREDSDRVKRNIEAAIEALSL